MNCRRTRSLLSAYIDREITGHEMLEMREHMSRCSECSSEYDSLLTVKRLLSALPDKEPRADMVWSINQIVSRNPVEVALDRFFPIMRFAATGAQPFGRRFVSAFALSVLGMLFIVGPETQSSRQLQTAGFVPMRETKFHSGRLARFEPIQYGVSMDPLNSPLKLSDTQMTIARQRSQADLRARSFGWINSVPVEQQYPTSAMTFQASSAPSLVYSGYSVSSR